MSARKFRCWHKADQRRRVNLSAQSTNQHWTAGAVELVDVHRRAVANPVSLSAVAAGDLKIAFRVILRELLGR